MILQLLEERGAIQHYESLLAHYAIDPAVRALIEALLSEQLPPSPLYYRGLVNLQRSTRLDMNFVQQLTGLLKTTGVKHPKKESEKSKVARPKKEKAPKAESVKAAKKPPKKIKPKKNASESTPDEASVPQLAVESIPIESSSLPRPAAQSVDPVDMTRWKDKTGYVGPVYEWYQRAISGGSRYSEGPVPWDRILFYAINKGCPLKYSSMATICGVSEDIVKNIVWTQYHKEIVTVNDIGGELFTIALNQQMVSNG